MYMDGYVMGGSYMDDVDGYADNFDFVSSATGISESYNLAYEYLQDTDNDQGVLVNDHNDLPNSVPMSALLPTSVEPTEGKRYFILIL